MEKKQDLLLCIVLENPPAGVDYALQKGRGAQAKPFQKQRAQGASLVFEFAVSLKNLPDASLDFSGPCVQGTKAQRFVYIDIGTYAGQANSAWSRRLKIPLSVIDAGLAQKAIADKSLALECKVAGTGTDGGPNSGAANPFKGWYIVSRE